MLAAFNLEVWIIASLFATAAAPVGVFLIWQGNTMLADGISHSVLPGIVLSFLIFGSRGGFLTYLGALLAGFATIGLVNVQHRFRVRQDAALAAVFPALFSLGVVLICLFARQVDLDLDCVLFGEIAFLPLDRVVIAGRDWGSIGLITAATMTLITTVAITLLFKELKMYCFDPMYCGSIGYSRNTIYYAFMALLCVYCVSAFEAVGSILVIAQLIIPAMCGFLITRSLRQCILAAIIIGNISAFVGYLTALKLDISVAGSIGTVSGLCFLVLTVIAPRTGLISDRLRLAKQRRQVDALLLLLHLSESTAQQGTDKTLITKYFDWTERRLNRIANILQQNHWAKDSEGFLGILPKGHAIIDKLDAGVLRHKVLEPKKA